MRLKRKFEENADGNIFWITMTDLMTGLVLVFIVMFFYTYMTSHLEIVKQKLAKENANKAFSTVSASAELREKLATNILLFIQELGIDGIDIEYKTLPNKVKETIILHDYKNKKLVRKLSDVDVGDSISISLLDGKINANVNKKENNL